MFHYLSHAIKLSAPSTNEVPGRPPCNLEAKTGSRLIPWQGVVLTGDPALRSAQGTAWWYFEFIAESRKV